MLGFSAFKFVRASVFQSRSSHWNCPEVALNVPGAVAIRDAQDPTTVLVMTPENWRLFTKAVKAGEFDLDPEDS